MPSSLVLALMLVLVSFTCDQVNSASLEICPATQAKQLTVNGCPVFVHDVTGTKDFVVEPLMCVTQSLSSLLPELDPLTQKLFVSVPVTLRDEAMLAQIKNQLSNLSPKSVKFAPVSKINVFTDASSKRVQALMFLWSDDEEVGYLRLGRLGDPAGHRSIFINLKDSILDAINGVTAIAEIEIGSALTELKYKVMVQNQSFFYPEFYRLKLESESTCDDIQIFKSVVVGKCFARVHQSKSENSRFYVEPLLCPSNNVSAESIMYDYNQDIHYLKLDVVLQDDATLKAVQNKLASDSAINVTFLQLYRVNIVVSPLLKSHVYFGPLMVSGDWRSGLVRVYCKIINDCELLRSNAAENALSFWAHVNSEVTSRTQNQCSVRSDRNLYQISPRSESRIGIFLNGSRESVEKLVLKSEFQTKTVNDLLFLIIQQRVSANMSFARTWHEYEAGFGDKANFWIGLSQIHSLTKKGVPLRVELKLADGAEFYQEYPYFRVENASSNYTLAVGDINLSGSSDKHNTFKKYNGMQFSTKDRDNDIYRGGSCSTTTEGGHGGWWFYNNCANSNPNTVYGNNNMWRLSFSEWKIISEFRLMVQI